MTVSRLYLLPFALLAASATGCHKPAGETKGEGAAEEHRDPPGVISLSAEEQEAQHIVVDHPQREHLPDSLHVAGVLLARPGSELVVKAPVAGVIQPADPKSPPAVGSSVARMAPLLQLQPVLTPQDQAQLVSSKAEAETVIRQAEIAIRSAQTQLARLKDASQSVPGNRIVELEETIARSQAAAEQARTRLPFLPVAAKGEAIAIPAQTLVAPLGGTITDLAVQPGQFVLTGDPLVTVADWSELWVRAAVIDSDVPNVDPAAEAHLITPLSRVEIAARPIQAALASPPDRRSVDRYFAVENPNGLFRPGMAVLVRLASRGGTNVLTISRSAVLWDALGASYAYVRVEDDKFARRRLELGPANGERMSVLRGLHEDDDVVIQGAQALYGQEFKSEPAE